MKKYKIAIITCLLTLFLSITFTSTNNTVNAQNDEFIANIESLEQLLNSKAARQNMIPPIKKKKMLAWLKAGRYKEQFLAEPTIHPSTGPHGGNVRTFYNSILVENLRAGKNTWDIGASMVKELYLGSTTQVSGYAVMIKVEEQSGNDGNGWVFFETFSGSADGAFYGQGLRLCSNCHRAGTDFLLATFRP